MKRWTLNVLRISVTLISIFVLLLCVYWLPKQANYFENIYPEYSHLNRPLIVGIYITGIPFFIAVYSVFKLLKLIEIDVAFSLDSIRYLEYIVLCSIGEIILYFLGMIYLLLNNALHPGFLIMGLLIIFIAFLIAVFVTILKELLLKAVEMKKENELTI
ncbi:MAG: DUF2975 domain-containing protein [Tissierellaceae bacterium]